MFKCKDYSKHLESIKPDEILCRKTAVHFMVNRELAKIDNDIERYCVMCMAHHLIMIHMRNHGFTKSVV
jgi:hypothetical protein